MDQTLFSEIQQLASAAQACAQAAQMIRDTDAAAAAADPAMPMPPVMPSAPYLPPGIDQSSAVVKPVRDILKKGELAELDSGVRVALEEIQKRVILGLAALAPVADPPA